MSGVIVFQLNFESTTLELKIKVFDESEDMFEEMPQWDQQNLLLHMYSVSLNDKSSLLHLYLFTVFSLIFSSILTIRDSISQQP